MATLLLSATQINMWRACPRQWAWRYVHGLKTEQSEAAKLGDLIDGGQLQPYLTEGRPLDVPIPGLEPTLEQRAGDIAKEALPYIPQPKTPGVVVQKHFEIPGLTEGIYFMGYMDLWVPDSKLIPGFDGGYPGVTDFKSTGNLRYAKKETVLRTDVQTVLYTVETLYETGAEAVDLQWLYLRTKETPKAKPVRLRMYGEEALNEFEKINATACEIAALDKDKAKTDPKSVPAKYACDEFNGCPYRANCNLSPREIRELKAAAIAENNKGKETMSVDVFAQLRALQGGKTPEEKKEPEQLPLWATAPVDPMASKYGHGPGQIKPINPPESLLPPAPTDVDKVETAPAARKRGRPPKAKDPVGADVHAALTETIGPAVRNIDTSEQVPTICNVDVDVWEPSTKVIATWGEELYTPVNFNSFRVGPFHAEGWTRKGETVTQALKRLHDQLDEFARLERTRKLDEFSKAVGA